MSDEEADYEDVIYIEKATPKKVNSEAKKAAIKKAHDALRIKREAERMLREKEAKEKAVEFKDKELEAKFSQLFEAHLGKIADMVGKKPEAPESKVPEKPKRKRPPPKKKEPPVETTVNEVSAPKPIIQPPQSRQDIIYSLLMRK